MSLPRITVILSVYGNAPYLPAFLESLEKQDCRNFRLLARIDGPESEAAAERILSYPFASLAKESGVHKGCTASYGTLLEEACGTADYILTADQDDVWDPDKIGTELDAMMKAERDFGKETPILVHSDLRVMNEDLRLTAASFMRYQSLSPRRASLKDLMIHNNITGCTVMINHALCERIRIPAEAICHDWYMALTAAAFGKIVYLDRPTVSYRQHSSNVFGAVPRRLLLKEIFLPDRLHEKVRATQKQAEAFLTRFGNELTPDQKNELEAWRNCLYEPSRWKRLRTVFAHGFRKNDLLRTIGLWWAI